MCECINLLASKTLSTILDAWNIIFIAVYYKKTLFLNIF